MKFQTHKEVKLVMCAISSEMWAKSYSKLENSAKLHQIYHEAIISESVFVWKKSKKRTQIWIFSKCDSFYS